MAHDVFISYSSQDKVVADAVCATLEGRKIRCWIAPRDVPPGLPYATALVNAINDCKVFVLVLSKGSNTSGQVLREVEEAVDNGTPIIPLRIEDFEPTDAMRYYIKSLHWLDAMTPPLERHLGKLAVSVQALLSVGVEEQPPPVVETIPVMEAPAIDIGQQVQFCTTSDGVCLSYAMIGEGPVLVKVANWLTHLDYEWRIPTMRMWLEELSRHHRLIRYDERGCGLSDWEVEDLSFDAWVRDLETIVQTLSLDQFSLYGMSQGGPVAIAYTVKHPDKVRNLILYGCYARGVAKHDLDDSQIDILKATQTLVERWWGRDNPAFRQFFSSLFIPEASEEQMDQFNELQRMSTSPENAVMFLKEFWNVDVRDLAPMVSVPTLILHCRDDSMVPFKEGRELAMLIPNSQFVPLESKNHMLLENEPAWEKFIGEFRHFVGIEEGC